MRIRADGQTESQRISHNSIRSRHCARVRTSTAADRLDTCDPVPYNSKYKDKYTQRNNYEIAASMPLNITKKRNKTNEYVQCYKNSRVGRFSDLRGVVGRARSR